MLGCLAIFVWVFVFAGLAVTLGTVGVILALILTGAVCLYAARRMWR